MTRKATIVGGGVIGGGWAARFLLNGWDVAIFDPDPEAERKISEVLTNARRALPSLYNKALPNEGQLSFHRDLAEALKGADWVQESVPERLDLKHKVHASITELAPSSAIIGSSTSGFKPSELAANGARVIVAHPFNPVYLLPLVELVGDHEHCKRAENVLRSIGMHPLMVRQEIDAHIADRLLEAVWRESLWLVKDGIATTDEIDEAIRMGFGLRWAQMGLFETYRIAGGEAGMKHFMEQFGPALKWPWTKLMDVPEFTDELVVGMMRALRQSGSGAGGSILAHEATLSIPEDSHPSGLPVTVHRAVPQSWTDYNGHMNEAHYVEVSGQATDRFMEMVGCDADYIATGGSYFTVDNKVTYSAEVKAHEMLTVTTQVLAGHGKKMHLFHRLEKADGSLAASVETLLIHVDLKTRRSSEPAKKISDALDRYMVRHKDVPTP